MQFVLAITWVEVKFGVNAKSIALETGKISQAKAE